MSIEKFPKSHLEDVERQFHEYEDDRPFVPEYEKPRLTKEELHGNFEGDWTSLLKDRFSHPSTKEKYFRLKKAFPTSEKRLAPDDSVDFKSGINLFKYTDVPPDEYEKMLSEEEYDRNLEKVFSFTRYVDAKEEMKSENKLGSSSQRGDEGVVFVDAKKHGQPLTSRQKNIIESHEKVHGLAIGLTKGERAFILAPFQEYIFKKKRVLEYPLDVQADEILARMTQLKNYFGFKGGEPFTRAHLEVAREHYVKDTGLDNNMTEFFDAIDRNNESEFLDRMNIIAC